MPKINYDIPDLRAFAELARTGGFNRAADALSITPSALSRRIAKLEEAVGGDLVARSTRGMALTTLGKRLLARTEPLLSALDDSVSEAARIARGLEGQVVVGCISSVAYSVLPEAIARFRVDYPDVRVALRDGEGPAVIDALQSQAVEFAITTFAEQPPDMVSELVLKDHFVAVCGSEHPLARLKKITWQILSEQRLVGFRAPSSSRRVLDAALGAKGIELTWFDEVDQLSSLIGFLRSGHFVGVIPKLLAPHIPGVKTFMITGETVHREIHLMRRKDTPLSTSALAFWHCVMDSAREQS